MISTDFTFWMILSVLIILTVSSVIVLVRSCITNKCDGLHDCIFGRPQLLEEVPRYEPVVYIVSPQVILENVAGVRRTPRRRELPPTDGSGYFGVSSTPPPEYDPPPAYDDLRAPGKKRRSASVVSRLSEVNATETTINVGPESLEHWL